jgi:hypothetical protein
MQVSRRRRPARRTASLRTTAALVLVGALAALGAMTTTALASGPATVSVRVQGLNTTLLAQTQVTTTTTPVLPDGTHACSPTSAGGALWDVTGGHWEGAYNSTFGYEVDGILGDNFPAFSANPDVYWSFWINGAPAANGACGQELNANDDIVFFAQCDAVGPDCTSATSPDHFLTEAPPASAVVQAGTPFAVTVGSLNTGTGATEALPSGVTVMAGGVTATPGAGGIASLTLPTVGTFTVQATAPDSVPSDPFTICVHNGSDGNCGTTVPATASATPTAAATTTAATTTTSTTITGSASPPPTVGATPPATAVAAQVSGLREGATYRAKSAPRVLAGTVTALGSLKSVKIRLTRNDNGSCSYFNGKAGRFAAMNCGAVHASFFVVGKTATFHYLLPSRLAAGRYVFDIEGVDNAGHISTLARGTSRIVFYVR